MRSQRDPLMFNIFANANRQIDKHGVNGRIELLISHELPQNSWMMRDPVNADLFERTWE